MFTDAQKIDIRRHCGFPVYGNTNTSPPTYDYRYFAHYQILEYRMITLSTDEEFVVINNYLVNCNALESAIPTASTNLDTDQAAVWYHNKNEVRDRFALYKLWCNRLLEFMGVTTPSKLLSQCQVIV